MMLCLFNDVIIIRYYQKIPWKIAIIRVLPKKFEWKFEIFTVIVLHGSVVAQLRCSG